MFLHGCTHGPEDLAEISHMNAVADANRFLVVYPEQSLLANFLKCWNWFDPKHQSRDQGEPSILAAIVEQVCSEHKVDPDRVYAAGVSAGGAMAVIAAVAYPDLFSGVAVAAACEFKAATSFTSAIGVMKHGGPDPIQQGELAFDAMQAGLARKSRRRMPLFVLQGTADDRVSAVNAEQLISQWSITNASLAARAGETGFALTENTVTGQVPGGYTYHKHAYRDQTGALLMEKWLVDGLGHAWSGSPKAQKYGDPKGPDAAAGIWRFFTETHSQ